MGSVKESASGLLYAEVGIIIMQKVTIQISESIENKLKELASSIGKSKEDIIIYSLLYFIKRYKHLLPSTSRQNLYYVTAEELKEELDI